MKQPMISSQTGKIELYRELASEMLGLLDPSPLANLANAAALLFNTVPDLNWAGFYLWNGSELVLGPFQGKVACVRIAMGRGVCGTSALKGQAILVEDVHEFPGHIACDAASRSELVIPILKQGQLIGVLDLDSPLKARFDEQDLQGLMQFVEVLLQGLDQRVWT